MQSRTVGRVTPATSSATTFERFLPSSTQNDEDEAETEEEQEEEEEEEEDETETDETEGDQVEGDLPSQAQSPLQSHAPSRQVHSTPMPLASGIPPAPSRASALPTSTPAKAEQVHVAVRTRPLIAKEKLAGISPVSLSCVWFPRDNPHQIVLGNDTRHAFTFDQCFKPEDTQQDVYETCVKPLVEAAFQGYNATVFAYGQTGSGKTWTMGSGSTANLSDSDHGIIPRVVRAVFDRIEECQSKAAAGEPQPDISVRISYLEIYNEEIRDLLYPMTPSKAISIREESSGGIVVVGVREEMVTTYEGMMRALQRGSVTRTTGSTLMNQHSSRSHAIFTIILQQAIPHTKEFVSSKFHLIDLAGSERAKKTGAAGQRLKESVTINRGLLALGNVISALAKGERHKHVPYRDSKLTRLLQDSLGGNSRTLMLACLSPAESNFEETHTTLKYANRAKNIKNKPVVNRDTENVYMEEMKRMALEIDALHQQLAKATEAAQPVPSSIVTAAPISADLTDLQAMLQRAEAQLSQLRVERSWLVHGVQRMTTNIAHLAVVESERDTIKERVIVLRQEYEQLAKQGDSQALRDLATEIKTAQKTYIEKRTVISDIRQQLSTSVHEFSKVRASIDTSITDASPTKKALRSARSSQSDSINLALETALEEASRRFEQAQSELISARDDLKRDDEIFEAKIAEIQALKTGHDEQQRQISSLKKQLTTMHQAMAKLTEQQKPSTPHTTRPPGRSHSQVSHHADLESSPREGAESFRSTAAWLAHQMEDKDDVLVDDQPTEMSGTSAASSAATSPVNAVRQLSLSNKATPPVRSASAAPIRLAVPTGSSLSSGLPLVAQSMTTIDEREAGDLSKLQAQVQQMEQERAMLMAEKLKAEHEAVTVEQSTLEQTKRFQSQQKKMDSRLRDLRINILMKQELIRDLMQQQHTDEQTQQRLNELEADLLEKQHQLQQYQKQQKGEVSGESRESLERQLATLRDHHSQLLGTLSHPTNHQTKIKSLESELQRMRSQELELKSRIESDSQHHATIMSQRQRELSILKKAAEQQKNQIQELETLNQKQQMVIKKKTEKMIGTRQLLQRASRSPVDRPGTGISDAPSSNEGKSKIRPRTAPSLVHRQAWLDRQIDQYMAQKEAAQLLQVQLQTREAIVREKEEVVRQKATLEQKNARLGASVSLSVMQLKHQVNDLNESLRNKEVALLRKSQSLQQAKANVGVHGEIASLQQEISALGAATQKLTSELHKLSSKQAKQNFLKPSEKNTLKQLEDSLEALEADIDYKSDKIKELTRQVATPIATEDFLERVASMYDPSDPGAGVEITKRYVEVVMRNREQDNEYKKKLREREIELEEQHKYIAELENSLQLATSDSERRIMTLEQSYLAKLQEAESALAAAKAKLSASTSSENDGAAAIATNAGKLEKLLQYKEEQIQILDKDNYYYKHTNRELKRKLRDLLASNASAPNAHQQHLEQQNQSLRTELENLKRYLASHAMSSPSSPVPVRMSLHDMRTKMRQINAPLGGGVGTSSNATRSQSQSQSQSRQLVPSHDTDPDPDPDPEANDDDHHLDTEHHSYSHSHSRPPSVDSTSDASRTHSQHTSQSSSANSSAGSSPAGSLPSSARRPSAPAPVTTVGAVTRPTSTSTTEKSTTAPTSQHSRPGSSHVQTSLQQMATTAAAAYAQPSSIPHVPSAATAILQRRQVQSRGGHTRTPIHIRTTPRTEQAQPQSQNSRSPSASASASTSAADTSALFSNAAINVPSPSSHQPPAHLLVRSDSPSDFDVHVPRRGEASRPSSRSQHHR